MKKILMAAIAAVMAVSVCSCGNPKNKNAATNAGNTPVIKTSANTTVGTRQTITAVTEVYGESDDLSTLSGTFVEYVDGEKQNYVFINELGNSYVEIGSKSPIPLGIETSEEGLMVYRGSKNPGDSYQPYTYDGTNLKFSAYDLEYEWKKIEKVDISGAYSVIDDGLKTDVWNFMNGKLQVFVEGIATNYTFEQTADKLILTAEDGTQKEYDYVFDLFSLQLKNDTEEIYFRAVI